MADRPLGLRDIVYHEGALDILIYPDSDWQNCYCQLADAELVAYRDNSLESPIIRVEISAATSVKTDGTPNALFFDIVNDGKLVLGCCAADPGTSRRWIESISAIPSVPRALSLADFQLLSTVHRGPLGKLILAERRDTRERFALKAVDKLRLLELGAPERVISERNVLLMIANPFVAELRFAFQTNTHFYLGLEYVPGGDLSYRLRDSAVLPLAEARFYIAEIVIAIGQLHAAGIIYRNLRPENIGLDDRGHIKLTGFRLAKAVLEASNSLTSSFCGTYAYLAPEIVACRPYSFEVDWWALGCVICELVTGKLPFAKYRVSELLQAIVNETPVIPSGIPEDLESLIAGLLDKDQAARMGYDQIGDHPFFRGVDWELVSQKKYRPPWVPPSESQRHPLEDGDSIDDPGTDILPIADFAFASPFREAPVEGLVSVDFPPVQ
jgi:serine/threonine protein kinase